LTCPNCTTELTQHRQITGPADKTAPAKGDRCLCIVCGAWLEFDGVRLVMAAPTVGDLEQLIRAMQRAQLESRRN
jgi:hypothetical protein